MSCGWSSRTSFKASRRFGKLSRNSSTLQPSAIAENARSVPTASLTFAPHSLPALTSMEFQHVPRLFLIPTTSGSAFVRISLKPCQNLKQL